MPSESEVIDDAIALAQVVFRFSSVSSRRRIPHKPILNGTGGMRNLGTSTLVPKRLLVGIKMKVHITKTSPLVLGDSEEPTRKVRNSHPFSPAVLMDHLRVRDIWVVGYAI